jgi:hypothetical protein
MTTINHLSSATPLCRWSFFACMLAAACAPQSEKERDYFRKKESERIEHETLTLSVVESAKDIDVLMLVKQSPAPDGSMNTESWVDGQMGAIRGQVIFPRWEVSRRSSSKYEARYTYTLLNDENDMSKLGWRWDVDFMLKVVSPPREIQSKELQPRERSRETLQQQRRIRKEERSLE